MVQQQIRQLMAASRRISLSDYYCEIPCSKATIFSSSATAFNGNALILSYAQHLPSTDLASTENDPSRLPPSTVMLLLFLTLSIYLQQIGTQQKESLNYRLQRFCLQQSNTQQEKSISSYRFLLLCLKQMHQF